jgi:acetyl esterase/lipase
MTDALKRRAVLQAGAAMLGAGMLPASAARAERSGGYEFLVKDIVYQRSGGKERLARLYQPAGTGPFPAVLQVHGGAWNDKDRTDGQNVSLDLAEAGIVVLAIDFRNAGEAPYPASLQDINYGIRWLKAHAGEFGSSAGQVGAYGTSSGGHQALLAAIRPDDPRYRTLSLADAPDMDAKIAFVMSGWGVLFPLERYKLAKVQGKPDLAKDHDRFFGSEATQIEATPALILERGEKVFLPPALVFQGTKDQWTTVELAERFATDYRKAGGSIDLLLLDGARHTFLNEHPFEPNSKKALKAMIAFVKQHGSERRAAR